jgi:hypothetical protein
MAYFPVEERHHETIHDNKETKEGRVKKENYTNASE